MWNECGRPGTPFSLVLKMLQGIFSLTSFMFLMSAPRLMQLKVFGFMMLATLIGAIWSLAIFCLYMVLMIKNAQIHRVYLVFLVVGDIIASFVYLSSAIQSLGPALYFAIDTKWCSVRYHNECKFLFLAIGVDVAAWFCAFISFMFVLRHRISRRGR
ncbi:uncharacterized protein LOC109844357 [Asparagus officinalis]|uniref:uncharacterized protein LOC109844357 n=1 Tax=Asparagus officinalis TaxID=4686 RepID=UPI00098E5F58|nr:uncharacterized protein LOC109844357 [Asparagus officinalis]XP_020268945.1 uncharacterized protein LOC109844357 [Asparagus officinalis]XP_020268946.1 uncharacterized protein LOC109844357 [Asparagus officinalis]